MKEIGIANRTTSREIWLKTVVRKHFVVKGRILGGEGRGGGMVIEECNCVRRSRERPSRKGEVSDIKEM